MNTIQRLRQERGLSQRDLAARSGVSAGTIACAERPGAMPQLDTAVRIARALGVPVEELLSSRENELDKRIEVSDTNAVASALKVLGFQAKAENIAGSTPREIAQMLAPTSRLRRRMAQSVIEGALEHTECASHARCSHDK